MKKLQLLIKPVSSACNLKCAYCFYRDEEQHRMDRGRGRMDTETVKVGRAGSLRYLPQRLARG